MARDLPPQTPTRRSRRFQPLATPLLVRNQSANLECAWQGEPIYIRPCNPELDLMQEELDEREQRERGEEDDEEDDTLFYASFTMKRQKPKQYRGRNGAGARAAGAEEVYRLGDTIMVETDTLYRQKRPPSVAVIIAMWEVRKKGEELRDERDPSRMRLRVHWFLRPTELAAIRQKREHAENEIYYSLASSDILLPEVIISRCSVSSHKGHIAGFKEKRAYIPARGARSPKKSASRRRLQDDVDLSEDASDEEGPGSSSSTSDEKFYCQYAINSQRGLYYNLNWEGHHESALKTTTEIPEDDDAKWGQGSEWNVDTTEDKRRKKKGLPPRKRAKLDDTQDASGGHMSEDEIDSGSEAEIDSDDSDDDDDEMDLLGYSDNELVEGEGDEGTDELTAPRTPSRKRKRAQSSAPKTPRKGRKTLAQPTPHSKAALKRRQKMKHASSTASPRKKRGPGFVIKPPTLSFNTDMSHLPRDPWLRAMHVLHVGNRPDALPCRGEEYEKVLRCVGDLLEEGSGGCVYISGVPGTGKTATVHTVVRELKRMAESNEISPFTYVEINGLRIPEPSVAYTLLWEAVVRNADPTLDPRFRVGAKESLKALTHYFSGRARGPAAHAYVVLMDELDQLVTAKQDVIYNFFNWPTLAGSNLVVIAVANTMDLPERVMTGRVRSRLGMTRINFQPYTTVQLEQIVHARLATAKEGLGEHELREVMAKDAIKLAAVRISRITGDARRVLDVCRRVVEHVSSSKTTAGPSHVTKILSVMQSSPTAGYLHDCSLHERIMLASLIKCIKREGVEEIKWDDVQYQHMTYLGALVSVDDAKRKPTPAELTMVLNSLVASRAVLLEDGAAIARKPEGERRLLLNIEQIEVERVLSDVGGPTWKNVLST